MVCNVIPFKADREPTPARYVAARLSSFLSVGVDVDGDLICPGEWILIHLTPEYQPGQLSALWIMRDNAVAPETIIRRVYLQSGNLVRLELDGLSPELLHWSAVLIWGHIVGRHAAC